MTAALAVAVPSRAAPTDKWTTLGYDILKELIETNSIHAKGSTEAAHKVEARLLAAGFARSDIHFLVPPGHPTKGNVIVRLKGNGKAKPVLYIGHLDVVEAERADWTTDPFKLTEKDGFYYGRGTIDMKGQDAAVLVALIRMKKEGLVPDRDIIVALTADEEAGGDANGVDWLLKTHRDLVDAGFSINPDGAGDAVTRNGRPLYIAVETSEKQYMTFSLSAADKGGHSSRPTPENPVYHVAAVVDRLSKFQFPLHLTETGRAYFARRAEMETGQVRADMRAVAEPNPDEAAVRRLSDVVETNILLRSTCVATEFHGGRSESALPVDATATIQCRIVPGETLADVQKTLTDIVADPKVKLTVVYPPDVSPESPLDPVIMGKIRRLATEKWPGIVILPEMAAGASDSAFTRQAGIPSYGVDALFEDIDDDRAHGRDERIGIADFAADIDFSYRLMKDMSRAE